MNIGNATSVGTIVNSPQPAPSKPEKTAEKSQESTVVKLSDRAQQLSRSDTSNQSQNINTERRTTKPQEMTQPPGINFMTSYDKGGKVSMTA